DGKARLDGRSSIFDLQSSILDGSERKPERVGSAPRAVLFVPGGPERRTHRATLKLAADARAIAQLYRSHKSFLPGIIAQCSRLGRIIVRSIPQVIGHGRRIDDLAGIEKFMGIKGLFDLAESFIDSIAEHLSVPLAACQPIAV